MTSDLLGGLAQHRGGTVDGFTKRYGVDRLVYFELTDKMESAIARERQLKRYRREWKCNLIDALNPTWDDLAVGLGLGPLAVGLRSTVDPGTRPG